MSIPMADSSGMSAGFRGSGPPSGHQITVSDLIGSPQFASVTVFGGASGLAHVVNEVRWWADGRLGVIDGALLVVEVREPLSAYRLDEALHAARAGGCAAVILLGEPQVPVLSSRVLADRLGVPLLGLECTDPRTLSIELAVAIRSPEVSLASSVKALIRKLRTIKRSGEGILNAFTQVTGLKVVVVAGDGSQLLGDGVELPSEARPDRPVPQRLPAPNGGMVVMQPIQTQALRGGEVWLATEVPSAVGTWVDATADLLTVLEPVVAAWLVDERLHAEQKSQFRSRLLQELLSAGESAGQKLAQQAVAAGWQLLGWHTGFFIGMSDVSLGMSRRDVVVMQSERVRRAMQSVGVASQVVELPDGWAAWVTSAIEHVDRLELTDLVGAALSRLPQSWRAYAGIGRPHGGMAGLAVTLGEARDAANLARTQVPGHRTVHIDELGAARIVTAVRQSSAAIAHANSLLSPLRQANGGVLLDTLRVYLDNRSSLGLTAEVLNLHRNTVSGRLARIRQLLGVDLDDPEERLALSLACRIAESEG